MEPNESISMEKKSLHNNSTLRMRMGDDPSPSSSFITQEAEMTTTTLPAPRQTRMPPIPSVLSILPSAAWKWHFLEGLFLVVTNHAPILATAVDLCSER